MNGSRGSEVTVCVIGCALFAPAPNVANDVSVFFHSRAGWFNDFLLNITAPSWSVQNCRGIYLFLGNSTDQCFLRCRLAYVLSVKKYLFKHSSQTPFSRCLYISNLSIEMQLEYFPLHCFCLISHLS